MPVGDSEHKGHKYLCSNPNCKKAFSRPKIIKYQVCPSCQTLVNMAETEKQGETPISSTPKKSGKLKKQKKVRAPAREKKPKGSEETISPKQAREPKQGKIKTPPVQHTKTSEAKTVSQSSSNCQYGFGYLNHRKKGEEIPDTCVECPKLLNCMLYGHYRKEESVAEIKKWYAT